MMIYLSALMSIPKELYEAADIDGIVGFKKHWAITIPHLMPMIALVSTISSISALKVFVEIYVMTKCGPLYSTKKIVLSNRIMNRIVINQLIIIYKDTHFKIFK